MVILKTTLFLERHKNNTIKTFNITLIHPRKVGIGLLLASLPTSLVFP